MATVLKKGLFITFEGTEGSGKSTQSKMLYEFLKSEGFKVLHLREPGSTESGEEIRKILLSPDAKLSSLTETLLYVAARAQLVEERILPALKKKMIVICDRFADATVCYQGHGLGVDIELIETLNKFATRAATPDITFFLDIGVEKGLGRSLGVKGFADRIERRSRHFHRKVRYGYLALIKRFPRRIKRISVEKNDRDKTQQIIRRAVLNAIVKRLKVKTKIVTETDFKEPRP